MRNFLLRKSKLKIHQGFCLRAYSMFSLCKTWCKWVSSWVFVSGGTSRNFFTSERTYTVNRARNRQEPATGSSRKSFSARPRFYIRAGRYLQLSIHRFISNREYSYVTFDESVIDELGEIPPFTFYCGYGLFSRRERTTTKSDTSVNYCQIRHHVVKMNFPSSCKRLSLFS